MTKLNIDNFIECINQEIIKDQREALKAVGKVEKRREAKYDLIAFDLNSIRNRLKKLRLFEKRLNTEIKKFEQELKQNQIKKQKDIKNKDIANKKLKHLIEIIKQTKKRIISLNRDMMKIERKIEKENQQEQEIKLKKKETHDFMKKLRQVIKKKISQENLLMNEIEKLEKEERKLKGIRL